MMGAVHQAYNYIHNLCPCPVETIKCLLGGDENATPGPPYLRSTPSVCYWRLRPLAYGTGAARPSFSAFWRHTAGVMMPAHDDADALLNAKLPTGKFMLRSIELLLLLRRECWKVSHCIEVIDSLFNHQMMTRFSARSRTPNPIC